MPEEAAAKLSKQVPMQRPGQPAVLAADPPSALSASMDGASQAAQLMQAMAVLTRDSRRF